MQLSNPAVIHVAGMIRPAAFTWQTATGVAWLEPGYLEADPAPAPAYHHFAGDVRDTRTGAVVYGAEDFALVFDFEAVRGVPALCPSDAARELERLAERLADLGTSWDQELVRMTAAVAPDLEEAGGLAGLQDAYGAGR